MADYSQYQGLNPDWEAFTQTAVVPPVGLNAGESPEIYRLARNSLRASASRIELESESTFFTGFVDPPSLLFAAHLRRRSLHRL